MKNPIFRTISNVVALIVLQIACQTAALAEHPGYLHAISDLRSAKSLLEHGDPGNVMKDKESAVQEIDACLHDLEHAAWLDHKNLHEHPFKDIGLDLNGRLHKSLDLLKKAHSDMDKEEDDPAAVGFQARAIKHVDRAIGFTRRAIGDKFDDSFLRL